MPVMLELIRTYMWAAVAKEQDEHLHALQLGNAREEVLKHARCQAPPLRASTHPPSDCLWTSNKDTCTHLAPPNMPR